MHVGSNAPQSVTSAPTHGSAISILYSHWHVAVSKLALTLTLIITQVDVEDNRASLQADFFAEFLYIHSAWRAFRHVTKPAGSSSKVDLWRYTAGRATACTGRMKTRAN